MNNVHVVAFHSFETMGMVNMLHNLYLKPEYCNLPVPDIK
jgi:hypothetical protein